MTWRNPEMGKTTNNGWNKVLETERLSLLDRYGKGNDGDGMWKRWYDNAMENIDVCCFTTIDSECSRTKKKIPMNSGCLCRDRQKKSLRQWDTRMSTIEVCRRFRGWCDVGETERQGKCRRRLNTSERYQGMSDTFAWQGCFETYRWLLQTDIQRIRGSPVKY